MVFVFAKRLVSKIVSRIFVFIVLHYRPVRTFSALYSYDQ